MWNRGMFQSEVHVCFTWSKGPRGLSSHDVAQTFSLFSDINIMQSGQNGRHFADNIFNAFEEKF